METKGLPRNSFVTYYFPFFMFATHNQRSMPKNRVTLQNIASQAGVARSTVSKALRNSKEIPEKTRLLIQRTAAELGYQPDPVVSNLMQQLRHIRNRKYLEPLAFISCFPEQGELEKRRTYYHYLLGAEQRGVQLGYQVQHHWFGSVNWSGKRLTQVLKARGIRGLLLSPAPGIATHIDMDWKQFAVVCFGYSLRDPACNRITSHHYHNMLRIFKTLDEYGYRRICLHLPDGAIGESRLNYNFSAAMHIYHQHIPEQHRIPPIRQFPLSPEHLHQRIQKDKIDVLISQDRNDLKMIEGLGYRVPKDISVAFYNASSSSMPGINELPQTVGATAVDMLAEQLYENRLGIPTNRKVVLIEGNWQDGNTIRVPRQISPSLNWNLILNH